MSVIKRVIKSKKAFYALVPVVANLVAQLFGIDSTEIFMFVLDAAFALLLVSQAALDLRYGSVSDGDIR